MIISCDFHHSSLSNVIPLWIQAGMSSNLSKVMKLTKPS